MIKNIQNLIKETIKTEHLEVLDESPNHSNYSGQVSHIKIIIVSNDFNDQKLLQRHQMVYKALGHYVEQIHAISIVAKTFAEWEKSQEFQASPPCSKI